MSTLNAIVQAIESANELVYKSYQYKNMPQATRDLFDEAVDEGLASKTTIQVPEGDEGAMVDAVVIAITPAGIAYMEALRNPPEPEEIEPA